VEPLAVVMHTTIQLRPEQVNYAKPRIELECLSKTVSVVLRSCQVSAAFSTEEDEKLQRLDATEK